MAETTPKSKAAKRSFSRNMLNAVDAEASDVDAPYIEETDLGPTSFAVDIDEASTEENTVFTVDEDRLKKLHFTKPGARVASKKLFTVKAFNPNGTLIQLPFEAQIQNTAASSREDAIGLRRYQSKGFQLLYDFDTGRTIYCATWDCWAQARPGNDFCSDGHQNQTMPRQEDTLSGGAFTPGATTKRVWNG